MNTHDMTPTVPKHTTEKTNAFTANFLLGDKIGEPSAYFQDLEPLQVIESGKTMSKAWIQNQPQENRILLAQHFLTIVVQQYWNDVHQSFKKIRSIPRLFENLAPLKLDNAVVVVANAIGHAAACFPNDEASYHITTVYTSLLPQEFRTKGGVFYTAPALVKSLLDMTERAGAKWDQHTVLDPACGGGAFLGPVCSRIIPLLTHRTPIEIVEHIQTHVKGWEIDPFSAWMTQVFVEVVLKEVIEKSECKFHSIVRVIDSLKVKISEDEKVDLVVGNPPYGKVKQTSYIKNRFRESLYGHPNLYGIFTHLAIELTKANGIVSFVTPTSWLSGEYFKRLREYARIHTIAIEANFVSSRKGVFDDALQEIMLFSLKKDTTKDYKITVKEIEVSSPISSKIKGAGDHRLPTLLQAPWILARNFRQVEMVKAMADMPNRLKDIGVKVKTGPLVWNRHKPQLSNVKTDQSLPIVWAESIIENGTFKLKAEKKNHRAFIQSLEKEDWLVTSEPCVLLQRTTSKEQKKRLIAAVLPKKLWKQGVAIENHINILTISPCAEGISPEILSTFLNSRAVNLAFTCISGSVAVSAYELENLPVPSTTQIFQLQNLLNDGSNAESIERLCDKLYSAP